MSDPRYIPPPPIRDNSGIGVGTGIKLFAGFTIGALALTAIAFIVAGCIVFGCVASILGIGRRPPPTPPLPTTQQIEKAAEDMFRAPTTQPRRPPRSINKQILAVDTIHPCTSAN